MRFLSLILCALLVASPAAAQTKAPITPYGIGQAGLGGFRNKLRNGNFAVNQRGVAGTVTLAAGAYGHDSVKGGGSGGTYTFATAGLDTTLTITANTLVMVVDGAQIEGGNYALSWSGTATCRSYVQGAGSTPAFAAMPAGGLRLTGVTAATNQVVECTNGTLTRVQYEPGAAATPFERSPFEVQRCQRYYVRMRPSSRFNASAANQLMDTPIFFPVTMRAQPTSNGITGGTRSNISNAVVTVLDAGAARHEIVAAASGDTYALGDLFEFSAEQ